ncbi:MAG TPA: hypothetical protein VF840_10090 [Terriglobales bacterium]
MPSQTGTQLLPLRPATAHAASCGNGTGPQQVRPQAKPLAPEEKKRQDEQRKRDKKPPPPQ